MDDVPLRKGTYDIYVCDMSVLWGFGSATSLLMLAKKLFFFFFGGEKIFILHIVLSVTLIILRDQKVFTI